MKKVIAKNASFLAAQKLFLNLLSIFFIGYFANKVGVKEYGIFVFAFSFTKMLSFLGNLGTRTVTVREISKTEGDSQEIFQIFHSLRIKLSILAFASIIVFINILQHSEEIKMMVYIAGLSQIFCIMYTTSHTYFEAKQKMQYITIPDMICRILVILISLILLYLGHGIIAIAWVYVLGNFLEVFINNYVLQKVFFIKPTRSSDFQKEINLVKRGIPFALYGAFAILLTEVDKTMLMFLKGEVAVAVYGAANLFYRTLNVVSDSIATALFPAIVVMFKEKASDNSKKLSEILTICLAITLPMAVGGSIVSKDIIALVFHHPDYSPAYVPLAILLWNLPIFMIASCLGQTLIAVHKERLIAITAFLNVFLNIMLNFIFIPIWSSSGAALALVISSSIYCLILSIYAKSYFQYKQLVTPFAKLIVCNAFMGCLSYYLTDYNLFVNIILSGIFYLGLLKIFRLLPNFQNIREKLRRKK